MANILQSFVGRNGHVVSTRVEAGGSTEVWKDGTRLSLTPTAFEFAPRVNGLGDVAWANVFGDSAKDSTEKNDIYLNGRMIVEDVSVQDIALTDSHLVWISVLDGRSTVSYVDLLTGATSSQVLDFAADRLAVVGGAVVAAGLDVQTGHALTALLSAHQSPQITDHGDDAVQLSAPHLRPMLVTIEGDLAAKALFNAMTMISEYAGEALAAATSDTGRVVNMSVPRLQALVSLAEATGDPDLKARAVDSALASVGQADVDGLYYSTRYSIADDQAAWSMHAALINGAALSAIDWMTAPDRQKVIDVAKAAFDHFESDWINGAYVITPSSGVDYDGIIQPNNMQAVMGTYGLQLFEATGEQRYLDRANEIFALLSQEIVEYQGTGVFYYWPVAFRDGWSEGEYQSQSRPTGQPEEPGLYDDLTHGALVIAFLEQMAALRGEAPLVDTTALFDLVQRAPYDFYGYFNGGPSGLEWLPPWPSAAQFLEIAARPFPTTLGVYDEGIHVAAVAEAAARLASGGFGSLTVELSDPVSGALIETVTLNGAAELLSWIKGLETRYGQFEAPSGYVVGDDLANTLAGTSGDDVVRGAGGNDTIRLGDGDDEGFGDEGDDFVFGDGGDDVLAGGNGDDRLFGGSGNDRLHGQAGGDTLAGGDGDDLLSGGDGFDELDGGNGDDWLYGGTGNDVLFGGAGADRLYGGDGNDRLDAWEGEDGQCEYLYGEAGNDTYTFWPLSNYVYIGSAGENAGSGEADRVILRDLRASDISLGRADYSGTYPSEGVSLVIVGASEYATGVLEIANGGQYIEQFEFADGKIFNRISLTSDAGGLFVSTGGGNDLIFGGAGTDRIYGGDGADYLNAGAGVGNECQYLFGEAGDDVYAFGTVSAYVYIGSAAESLAGGHDRVVFSDLRAVDVALGEEDYRDTYASEGVALTITGTGRAGSGRFEFANGGVHIEEFEFADGRVFQTLQTTSAAGGLYVTRGSGQSADLIFGGAGVDRIYAGSGNDILNAGGSVGADCQYLYGEEGDDTYVFGAVSGYVYVGSSAESAGTGTADRVIFSDLKVTDITLGFEDYRNSYPSEGLAIVINGRSPAGTGRLEIANGAREIEAFEFADGRVFNTLQRTSEGGGAYVSTGSSTSADLIFGGAGTDRIYAGAGHDLLDAGQGVVGECQYLYGEAGNDTYLYGTRSEYVYIGSAAERAGTGLSDRVILTDLRLADIQVTYEDYRSSYPAEGLALVIRWQIGGVTGRLEIANLGAHIEAFEFADGSVFTAQDLVDRIGSALPSTGFGSREPEEDREPWADLALIDDRSPLDEAPYQGATGRLLDDSVSAEGAEWMRRDGLNSGSRGREPDLFVGDGAPGGFASGADEEGFVLLDDGFWSSAREPLAPVDDRLVPPGAPAEGSAPEIVAFEPRGEVVERLLAADPTDLEVDLLHSAVAPNPAWMERLLSSEGGSCPADEPLPLTDVNDPWN